MVDRISSEGVDETIAKTTDAITTELLNPVVDDLLIIRDSVDGEDKRVALANLTKGLGYTPAGTGAVATTVQEKLREVVSVKDFGAIGNGVANDTAAIQAAIDFVATRIPTGGTVFFPAGNYATTDLTVPGNLTREISLIGDYGVTVSALPGTSVLLTIQGDISRNGFLRIEGIVFDGNDLQNQGGTNRIGIFVNQMLHINIKNVFVRRVHTGIVLDAIQEIYIEDTVSAAAVVGWYMINSDGGLTASKFTRCSAQDNTKFGWIVDGSLTPSAPAQTISWDSCLFQVNTLCGFFANRVSQVQIRNCHFEVNGRLPAPPAYESVTMLPAAGSRTYTTRAAVVSMRNSNIEFSNTEIPDSTTSRIFILERNSLLRINDSGGTGNRNGRFINADATSRVIANGFLTSFISGNFYEKFPDTSRNFLQSVMTGQAIYKDTKSITNFAASSATNDTFSFILNGQTQTFQVDPNFGRTTQIVFPAVAGSSSVNQLVLPVWPSNTIEANHFLPLVSLEGFFLRGSIQLLLLAPALTTHLHQYQLLAAGASELLLQH